MPRKKKSDSEIEAAEATIKDTAQTTRPEIPDIVSDAEGVMCPACGRFVGGYERCPHCQAVVEKRLPILYVRRIAVIGSIIGLILMWFAAINKEPAQMKIGEIRAQNNMALVKVVARVSKVSIRENNTFTIKVEDKSGSMALMGFDKLKRFQKHFKDHFPAEGDMVEAIGNLNISEKFGVSMFLSDPRRLTIKSNFAPQSTTIENIDADAVGEVLKIRVKIVGIRQLKAKETGDPFATVITVKDETGNMDMTLFDKDLAAIPNKEARENLVQYGAIFDLHTMITEYKGRLQLKIRAPELETSITLVSAPSNVDTSVKIGEIREEMVDENVVVVGKVISAKTFKFGTSIDIQDDTGKVNVWITENLRKFVKDINTVAQLNSTIKVRGVIKSFKGKMQVTPMKADDVKLLKVTSELPIASKVSDLNESMVGKLVTITGQVESAKEFDFGLISMDVRDTTGLINVVIKQMSIPLFTDKTFMQVGKKLNITGRVDRYKEKMQIILSSPDKLKVIQGVE